MRFKQSVVLATVTAALVAGPALGCDGDSVDPSRMAVAGGSITEILFALGAEDLIVAADRTSNYPAAASAFPSVGYVRALSAEGVLSLNPTLLIGEDDMGPPEVVAQIRGAGVETIVIPEQHSAIGILAKVRCIGEIVGRQDAAERLIAETLTPISTKIAAQSARSRGTAPRGAVLLGLRDGAPLGAGLATSGNGLLEMAATENVFDTFSGWKPVSMEAMLQANPTFFVVPERGINDAGGLDELLKHPALRLTDAARNRQVIVLDGMAMLGFGPRTLESAAALADAVHGTPRHRETLNGSM
ncbi:MAG: ABC transporter substrate-binding protein [Pseudomonadota bacterium]